MTTSIPLNLANFCSNCESITEQSSGSTCPVCESRAVRPLSSFLNREVPQTMPELSAFVQIMTPERIRELLGVPTEE